MASLLVPFANVNAVSPLALYLQPTGKSVRPLAVAAPASELANVKITRGHALHRDAVCLAVDKVASTDNTRGQTELAMTARQAVFVNIARVVRAARVV